MWNPGSSSFATAGGNGVLPGTAAGSQCFLNAATTWNCEVGLCNGNSDESYGQSVVNVSYNKRYTMTVAVGSPLGATIMDGQAIDFADLTSKALVLSHEDMYPNGWYINGANNGGVRNMNGFMGWGGFGDISYSLSSNAIIGAGIVHNGDGLLTILGTAAGTAWSNVRMISQNWAPTYGAGTFNWDNNTTSAWASSSGGPYGNNWTAGADAVFEGNGGTVTVAQNITSVNSLNFNTDWTTLGSTAAGYQWIPTYTLKASGSGAITLTGDAVITVGAGTDSTTPNAGGGCAMISCPIGGTAGMYKAGAGFLLLTGVNNYTGGTTVGGGTLMIGNGGTTGSIVGNVSNLANLAFNRSDTVTFGGNISGTGSVDILGTGASAKTIFTANNTYAGITTVHAGSTLQLGNGGSTGSITGDVVNNGNLVFNHSDKVTYSGVIHDGNTFFPTTPGGNGYSYLYNNEVAQRGALTQAGSGTLILTNAQSNYSGVTNVESGALQLDGASPTMNVLTNAGGVNITGGMLILDYTSGSDPASLVASLLTAEAASHFQTGQIRDTALPAGETLTWADSPTINGQTYTNEVVVKITPVPEPSTLALLGIGAVSLLAYAWRRCRS
jgi:autotransporter-associated beta strand protein